jgi:hypothetical protein
MVQDGSLLRSGFVVNTLTLFVLTLLLLLLVGGAVVVGAVVVGGGVVVVAIVISVSMRATFLCAVLLRNIESDVVSACCGAGDNVSWKLTLTELEICGWRVGELVTSEFDTVVDIFWEVFSAVVVFDVIVCLVEVVAVAVLLVVGVNKLAHELGDGFALVDTTIPVVEDEWVSRCV